MKFKETENMTQEEYERWLINNAIDSVEKCIKEHKDMDTALLLLAMCKYIGGDKFHASIERG